MKYDKDVQQQRWFVLLLTALNIMAVGWGILKHEWMYAITGMLWTANTLIWLTAINAQQVVRDQRRLLEAVLVAMKESNKESE